MWGLWGNAAWASLCQTDLIPCFSCESVFTFCWSHRPTSCVKLNLKHFLNVISLLLSSYTSTSNALGFLLCKWCDCFCPEGALSPSSEVCSGDTELSSPTQNSTDEEKLIGMSHRMAIPSGMPDRLQPFTLENRWFLCAFVILCVSGSCVLTPLCICVCLSFVCLSLCICMSLCVCVSLSCGSVFVHQCLFHFSVSLILACGSICLWFVWSDGQKLSFFQSHFCSFLFCLFVTGCLDYYFCTFFFTTSMVCLLCSQAVPGDTIQCPRVHREWLFRSVCLVSALCHGPEWRYGSFFVQ